MQPTFPATSSSMAVPDNTAPPVARHARGAAYLYQGCGADSVAWQGSAVDWIWADTSGTAQVLAKAKPRRLRIAYLIPHHNVTGGMKMIMAQIRALRARGHHITAVFRAPPGVTDVLPAWTSTRVDATLLLPANGNYGAALMHADVVMVGYFTQLMEVQEAVAAAPATGLVSRTPGTGPALYWDQGHEHVFGDPTSPAEWDQVWHRCIRGNTALAAVSGIVQHVLAAHHARFAPVIPNAIDTAKFHPGAKLADPSAIPWHAELQASSPAGNVTRFVTHPQAGRPFRVLLVGNPGLPLKNFNTALQALNHLHRTLCQAGGPGITVVWVCQVAASVHGVEFDVQYIVNPPQRDLPGLYAAGHDALLFTSVYEAWGMPVLEAMASGLPVVASRCHGVDEFAQHGVTCLLADPYDAPGLAAQLQQLAQHPALAARLAEQARHVTESLHWDRAMDYLESALYTVQHWLGYTPSALAAAAADKGMSLPTAQMLQARHAARLRGLQATYAALKSTVVDVGLAAGLAHFGAPQGHAALAWHAAGSATVPWPLAAHAAQLQAQAQDELNMARPPLRADVYGELKIGGVPVRPPVLRVRQRAAADGSAASPASPLAITPALSIRGWAPVLAYIDSVYIRAVPRAEAGAGSGHGTLPVPSVPAMPCPIALAAVRAKALAALLVCVRAACAALQCHDLPPAKLQDLPLTATPMDCSPCASPLSLEAAHRILATLQCSPADALAVADPMVLAPVQAGALGTSSCSGASDHEAAASAASSDKPAARLASAGGTAQQRSAAARAASRPRGDAARITAENSEQLNSSAWDGGSSYPSHSIVGSKLSAMLSSSTGRDLAAPQAWLHLAGGMGMTPSVIHQLTASSNPAWVAAGVPAESRARATTRIVPMHSQELLAYAKQQCATLKERLRTARSAGTVFGPSTPVIKAASAGARAAVPPPQVSLPSATAGASPAADSSGSPSPPSMPASTPTKRSSSSRHDGSPASVAPDSRISSWISDSTDPVQAISAHFDSAAALPPLPLPLGWTPDASAHLPGAAIAAEGLASFATQPAPREQPTIAQRKDGVSAGVSYINLAITRGMAQRSNLLPHQLAAVVGAVAPHAPTQPLPLMLAKPDGTVPELFPLPGRSDDMMYLPIAQPPRDHRMGTQGASSAAVKRSRPAATTDSDAFMAAHAALQESLHAHIGSR